MKHSNIILTGCDSRDEWLLPWFFENYHKHNNTPIVFADFGMKNLKIVEPYVSEIIDMKDTNEHAFRKKAKAAKLYSADKIFWIDTDCEVLGNFEDVFDLLQPNKINMIQDRPLVKRKKRMWYNAGVFGIVDKPKILDIWIDTMNKNPKNKCDQTMLNELILKNKWDEKYMNELPNEYNWLRIQVQNDNQDSPNKKIMHWTGPRGKQVIKDKIAKK